MIQHRVSHGRSKFWATARFIALRATSTGSGSIMSASTPIRQASCITQIRNISPGVRRHDRRAAAGADPRGCCSGRGREVAGFARSSSRLDSSVVFSPI
jgi:hypothetical protein